MPTQAVFYRDSKGRQPVKEFLEETFPLQPRGRKPSEAQRRKAAKQRATIDLQIDRLNGLPDELPPLEYPTTSQIDGQLRELRCHLGNDQYRVLYRRSGNLFVLLHMIYKNTDAVPPAEIEVAKQRWDDFKARMDASKRRPPRAAGADAPRRKMRKIDGSD